MGGFSGGSGKTSGSGGLSDADIAAIQQALGMGTQMISNRYQQLGLGVPDPNVFGGNPATAAGAGGSLQFGSPGTAEQTDIAGLGNMAQAALGQLQTNNISNPAVPGTPANQAFQSSQLGSLGQAAGFNAGTSGGGVNLGNPTTG